MSTTEQIKELRSRTGCGIIDCQQALAEANDNIDEAITILRQKGMAQAAKKAERDTKEGTVAVYVHSNNKLAALVTLLCETDFVAKNIKFQNLAKDIAMHIAAMDPQAIAPDDISVTAIAAEKAIAAKQAKDSDKPAEIQDKMIAGKLSKFKTEHALLTQPFVKDPNKTIEQLIKEAIQELGENISVGEFTRLAI